MKKVLITGGNGNLGYLVAQRLAASGVEIVRFDLPGTEKDGPGSEVTGDIRDRDLMQNARERGAQLREIKVAQTACAWVRWLLVYREAIIIVH